MKQETNENQIQYTQSMPFQVSITARYISFMANQAFEKLNIDISSEEYVFLDIIANNAGICHRDLAKMLLRDRSNSGKIVSKLEKFGLVKIKLDTRNNRTIKRIYITAKGKKLYDNIYKKTKPFMEMLTENMSKDEAQMVSNSLKKFREIVAEVVETKI